LACPHRGELPIDRFLAEEALFDFQRRCRCTACGWRGADLGPDYSRQQDSVYNPAQLCDFISIFDFTRFRLSAHEYRGQPRPRELYF
jgi:hypothetical protein